MVVPLPCRRLRVQGTIVVTSPSLSATGYVPVPQKTPPPPRRAAPQTHTVEEKIRRVSHKPIFSFPSSSARLALYMLLQMLIVCLHYRNNGMVSRPVTAAILTYNGRRPYHNDAFLVTRTSKYHKTGASMAKMPVKTFVSLNGLCLALRLLLNPFGVSTGFTDSTKRRAVDDLATSCVQHARLLLQQKEPKCAPVKELLP